MISREQAVEIALEECRRQGWNARMPCDASFGRQYVLWGKASWFVVTNAESMGDNAYIHIDADTGEVTGAAYAPPDDPKKRKIFGVG